MNLLLQKTYQNLTAVSPTILNDQVLQTVDKPKKQITTTNID